MDEYDLNKDGSLNVAELGKLFDDAMGFDWASESMKIKEIQNWFEKYDTNKDGKLSIHELGDALNKLEWR
jgi:Ca2+-binding EF-hand superfamily protein